MTNLLWETAFDTIPDFVSIHNLEHYILKANQPLADYKKTTKQKLVGQWCFDEFHDDKVFDLCPIEQAVQNRVSTSKKVTIKNRYYLIEVSPLFNNDDVDELIGSICIWKDITEYESQKRIGEILIEKGYLSSEQLYAAIIEQRNGK